MVRTLSMPVNVPGWRAAGKPDRYCECKDEVLDQDARTLPRLMLLFYKTPSGELVHRRCGGIAEV